MDSLETFSKVLVDCITLNVHVSITECQMSEFTVLIHITVGGWTRWPDHIVKTCNKDAVKRL